MTNLRGQLSAAGLAVLLAACGMERSCPPELARATRLVVVTTASMDDLHATLETFERAAPEAPWRRVSAAEPAVVGAAGLGWGGAHARLGSPGDPIKQEGDKRAPAGVFVLGATFGSDASARPGHVQLAPQMHVCVDDVASPHYGRIVTRAEAGAGTSGEEMWRIPVYQRGIIVDYPANAATRSGSCIFVHIWTSPDDGTSGCVAAPEATVARLQDWTSARPAAIAILPASARRRLASCLPAVDAD